MKLNFWQIVGVILVVLALAAILYRELVVEKRVTPAQPAPTPALSTPATVPAGA